MFTVRVCYGRGWRIPEAPECPIWDSANQAMRYTVRRNLGVPHEKAWSDVRAEALLDDSSRLALIREVFNHTFRATEIFEEDMLGTELAYLLGAIAEDIRDDRAHVELGPDSALRRVLEPLGPDHPVWKFVTDDSPE